MSTRRKFTAEFKAKVALEAFGGGSTLAQLATKYGVHPNVVSSWKRQAQVGMVDVFSGKSEKSSRSHEEEVKDLHAKIGQLTIEKDFLQKAFARR